MKLLEKIGALLSGSTSGEIRDPDGIYFYVKCAKCGAPVRVRADRRHDLQRDFENGGYIWRKEIMDGSCFTLMQATIKFNNAQHIVEQTIDGGKFITWETYQALTQSETSSTS